jgi:asparagine synthase (glutamine-hydrolysing)
MADTLEHRGPDDAGSWVDAGAGLALGFRRLSILDLSPLGHQPMTSESGRLVVAFNGEVYNFRELRRELEGLGHRFRGHSDTEVLLAACEQWGAGGALPRLEGMFALALWDRRARRLTLARDRLGVKPLYYGRAGGALLAGSELKALRAHPACRPDVDRDALTLYLRNNYVPAPYSIYRGIFKLPPGTFLTLDSPEAAGAPPTPYWSARDVARRGAAEPFTGSDAEATDAVDGLLRQSVARRMVADVPLGAFLSGGVDSSAVVAAMQAQSPRPVQTFTIGFTEEEYDEAAYARAVARHLGTDHTELYVTPEEARAVIPRLPELFDEPFGDSSQIPTLLVSELARRKVTVSLSGDGGDELFGGYRRYFAAATVWRKLRWIPNPARAALARALRVLPAGLYNRLPGWLFAPVRRFFRPGPMGPKVHKFAELLVGRRPEEAYLGFVSHWLDPARVVIGGREPVVPLTDPARWADLPDQFHRMMYLDTISYLPDDILVKVDRTSMAVSLEARVPLIDDHRLVEFAWRLPLTFKVRDGQGKWVLRRVLDRYVPRTLIERPKMGFGVPIEHWLRGPLRDWAEALLDERRLREEGFLHADVVRARWQAHLSGEQSWHYELWDVLMFQAWLERWRPAAAAPAPHPACA